MNSLTSPPPLRGEDSSSALSMEITRSDLDWAVNRGLLTADQVEPLWHQWQVRQQQQDRRPACLSAAHVSYYLGTAIICLGLVWILYAAWANLWGGWVVCLIAGAYLVILYGAGYYLWNHDNNKRRLAGLLFTVAVCIVPIAVYGIQEQAGLWYRPSGVDPAYYNPLDHVNTLQELRNLLPMEISVLLATIVTLGYFPRAPLLTLVPLLVMWYMVVAWTQTCASFEIVSTINALYGVLCIAMALSVDRYTSSSPHERQDKTRLAPASIGPFGCTWSGRLLFGMACHGVTLPTRRNFINSWSVW